MQEDFKLDQIISNMKNSYRSFNSYEDKGSAVVQYLGTTDYWTFRTLFLRPDKLQFEWTTKEHTEKQIFRLCMHRLILRITAVLATIAILSNTALVRAEDNVSEILTDSDRKLARQLGFDEKALEIVKSATASEFRIFDLRSGFRIQILSESIGFQTRDDFDDQDRTETLRNIGEHVPELKPVMGKIIEE